MNDLQKALKQAPIVYVTRDIERALGLPKVYQNYHIISNRTPYAASVAKEQKNILLIKGKEQLDTRELLAHPKTKSYIKKISASGGENSHILVFKNTPQIEKICAENNWQLLNPPAALANMVEEKISQLHWLGELTKYLPPHKVMVLGEVTTPKPLLRKEGRRSPSLRRREPENGFPFILQFNRAHTGSGTMLIESEKQLNELKQKFPNREIRITQYIAGPAFTNNNVVWEKKVFVGNINYQITGLSPFTTRPFATIGNDWKLPAKLLSNEQVKQYQKMATDIGNKLAKGGWKGLFGIDVIMDEKTGKLYLIEINARQPASTTFESQLQQIVISNEAKRREKSSLATRETRSLAIARDDRYITTFEAYLGSLVGLPATSYTLQAIADGAQVVLKNKEKRVKSNELNRKIKKLKDLRLNIIPYHNTEPESDLLRIQCAKGMMEGHNVFNKIGLSIVDDLG